MEKKSLVKNRCSNSTFQVSLCAVFPVKNDGSTVRITPTDKLVVENGR
jgi:hypothetical protein